MNAAITTLSRKRLHLFATRREISWGYPSIAPFGWRRAKLTQAAEQVQNLIGNEHLAALESLAKANGKVAEILALLAFQEGFCLAMGIALDVHKHLHPPQSEQTKI